MLHDLLLKEIYIEALIRRNVFKTEDGRDLWQASNEELHAQLFDEEGTNDPYINERFSQSTNRKVERNDISRVPKART
ncbi:MULTISPECIES: Fur-regulated basic protein FbpA [Bacillus]|uniref:Fur-regulated basic protein FbpA n=1 Tax=Bacillus TaxID=1386 RepID=UPI0020C81A2D|nr:MULTISPECIES: Fur-regulated basic protein FbpA [Bacillus]